MRRIYYWADGTWCDEGDIQEYAWMSDDYGPIDVPWDIDDEAVDCIVAALISGG